MPQLNRVISLIGWTFWLHAWGYRGVGRRDILIVAVAFVLSALLWAMLTGKAKGPLLVMGAGELLCLADWGMLKLLPRLEISYSEVSSGLWFVLLGRGIVLAVANGLPSWGLACCGSSGDGGPGIGGPGSS